MKALPQARLRFFRYLQKSFVSGHVFLAYAGRPSIRTSADGKRSALESDEFMTTSDDLGGINPRR
jgi:hypothetical protein